MSVPQAPMTGVPPRIGRQIRLSRLALAAERLARAFWPVWVLAGGALAILLLADIRLLPTLALQAGGAGLALGLLRALWRGGRLFRWPGRAEAVARLDAALPGQPLAQLFDRQALGLEDAGSAALWRAHQARMAEHAGAARAAPPDPALARSDRFGLRHVALVGLVAGLLFGSWGGLAGLGGALPGAPGTASAGGPAWEGWLEPPAYTGRPARYLNEMSEGRLSAVQGALVTIRLYGRDGALSVRQSVGAPAEGDAPGDTGPATRRFRIGHDGEIAITGDGGRRWQVTARADAPPEIAVAGEVSRAPDGEMRLPFRAGDDFGVTSGQAVIRLDTDRVDRRHGLAVRPEPRAPLRLDLPMPVAGERTAIDEVLIADLSRHPFAGLPVSITLSAQDATGQSAEAPALHVTLPGRRFFEPLAKAIVEQRRDLLWSRGNGARVARVLRAISHEPDGLFRDHSDYLVLRGIIRDLEKGLQGGLETAQRDALAKALWDLALTIEEGDLDDAVAALERARERLAEAMRNGASDEEIRRLMEDYREAMQNYLRELARRDPEGEEGRQAEGPSRQITGDQLAEMMDRIEELMRQGRMEEAQRLLDMLSRMTENMRITRGEGGGAGQQAMEGLSDTLRDQQELSDRAFGQLQRRFGGGQGQGAPSQGENAPGEAGKGGAPGGPDDLADRQRALREELRRQQGALPGLGGEEGRQAGEALERAGRAMERAGEALRDDDLAGALDEQAEALEALREGMRNLSRGLARRDGGEGQGDVARGRGRDPLGRPQGGRGEVGTDREMLGGETARRRAEELRDEIRRRSSDRTRPEDERDYLERLLKPF